MLVSLLLCSLPLTVPVLFPLLASVAGLVASLASVASPVAPLGTVADYGSFDVDYASEVATLRAWLGSATLRASEGAPPRGIDGRFVKGPRTLPARDAKGRFIAARLSTPTVL